MLVVVVADVMSVAAVGNELEARSWMPMGRIGMRKLRPKMPVRVPLKAERSKGSTQNVSRAIRVRVSVASILLPDEQVLSDTNMEVADTERQQPVVTALVVLVVASVMSDSMKRYTKSSAGSILSAVPSS